MNYTYNISAIDTSTGTAYYKSIIDALQGIPAYVILVIVYIAFLAAYARNDIVRAHITASIVTTALSILFMFAEFIAVEIILIPIGLLVIGLIILGFTS